MFDFTFTPIMAVPISIISFFTIAWLLTGNQIVLTLIISTLSTAVFGYAIEFDYTVDAHLLYAMIFYVAVSFIVFMLLKLSGSIEDLPVPGRIHN